MIHKIAPILFVLSIYCTLFARPLNIIIVTSTDSSEDGYTEFLRDIYLDNANIEIDDDRYKESSLTRDEKQQLRDADLIIVSSKNSGGDYNADSAFWASLGVPILSHNISICRSNNHDNWDWFSSGQTTVSVSLLHSTFPNRMNRMQVTVRRWRPINPACRSSSVLTAANRIIMTARCMIRTACLEFTSPCPTNRQPSLKTQPNRPSSCCEMPSPTYSPNAGWSEISTATVMWT
ncbi:MAG: hypothetical protein ACYTE0_14685 [Planctomycetota bacterium]